MRRDLWLGEDKWLIRGHTQVTADWNLVLLRLPLRNRSTRTGSCITHPTWGSPWLKGIPSWQPVCKGGDVNGRVRPAVPPGVPSWALLPACSWFDPVQGGSRPSLYTHFLRACWVDPIPHLPSLLGLESCSDPQSPWLKFWKPATSLGVFSPRKLSLVPSASVLSRGFAAWDGPARTGGWLNFVPSDSCYCWKLLVVNYFSIHWTHSYRAPTTYEPQSRVGSSWLSR